MRCCANRISALLCLLALGACSAPPLRIDAAQVAQGTLNAQLSWSQNEVVLDALDHGIALDFSLSLRACGPPHLGWRDTIARVDRHLQLRYFPLSRRYQLRDLDRNETRTYAARALLVAAFEDLRLDLPAGFARPDTQSYAMRIDLERDHLPGALRLPALLDGNWRLSSGDYEWPATGAE